MTDLIYIFCEIDDFCKDFEKYFGTRALSAGDKIRKRDMRMTLAEVMTISIYYHEYGFTTFKDYYEKQVIAHMFHDFKLVSYNRFIELRKMAILPLLAFLVTRKMANCTGISYVDSFPIKACHIKRESGHKTMHGIAQKGKTSVGWFYGLKLHTIINHRGEIVSFAITSGNVADNNESILYGLTKDLFGKLFGDKGYHVRPEVREKIEKNNISIFTKNKKNMAIKPMLPIDQQLLKKRGIIESVGDILKNHLQLEQTRHRSWWGSLTHLFSSLIAYQMREKKPSIESFVNNLITA
jgi:Transposase DDE domain